MIIKYKGTDEHGVFRMGVTKLPNEEAVDAFLETHPEYAVVVEYPDDITVSYPLENQQGCPTCGPTQVEDHPRRFGVGRCVNCKEWLTGLPVST